MNGAMEWAARAAGELPGLAALLAAGLVVYWAGLVVATAVLLRRPPRRTYAGEIARGRPGDPGEMVPARAFRSWRVRSRGREIAVWEIEGRCAEGPVCVMVHGWGDSTIGAMARLEGVEALCSRVVAIDLPGHGESGGWARLGADEHVDVIAALEQAKAEWVVLFGWSLGAGVCLRAAAELAGRGVVAGVICEAPYLDPLTPARNVMRARGLPVRGVVGVAQRINGMMLGVGGVFGGAWRGFDRVGSARRLAEAGVPMLVVCGDADGVCPVEHAREIAAAAGASGSLIEVVGGGHTDLWSVPQHRARASGGVREFVSRVGGTGQGGRPN